MNIFNQSNQKVGKQVNIGDLDTVHRMWVNEDGELLDTQVNKATAGSALDDNNLGAIEQALAGGMHVMVKGSAVPAVRSYWAVTRATKADRAKGADKEPEVVVSEHWMRMIADRLATLETSNQALLEALDNILLRQAGELGVDDAGMTDEELQWLSEVDKAFFMTDTSGAVTYAQLQPRAGAVHKRMHEDEMWDALLPLVVGERVTVMADALTEAREALRSMPEVMVLQFQEDHVAKVEQVQKELAHYDMQWGWMEEDL